MDNVRAILKNKTRVAEEFNRIARRYDIATAFSQGYSSDLYLSVSRLELSGDEHIADLCCGTGKSTAACLQAVPRGHVTAVDFSSEMLAVARTSFGKDHSAEKVTFLLKDVMDLDLPDNSFDAIFMAYGIRNMPDYKRCLTNMLRLLKPGGRIIFHEYSLAENFLTRLYWNLIGFLLIIPFSWLLTGTVTIFQYLIKSVKEFPSPQKFRILLEEAGFTGINSMPLKSWRHPILHSFIAHKPI